MSKVIQAHLLGGPADGERIAVHHGADVVHSYPRTDISQHALYKRYFDIDEDNAVFLHNMLGEHEAKMLLCRRYFDVPWH